MGGSTRVRLIPPLVALTLAAAPVPALHVHPAGDLALHDRTCPLAQLGAIGRPPDLGPVGFCPSTGITRPPQSQVTPDAPRLGSAPRSPPAAA
jgi:hypothetical protein